MKKEKLILTIAFMFTLALGTAFSQVQKGDSNIGLNTQVSSFVGVGSPNANGLISFSYQYYVTNNISLGFGPFYRFSNSKTEGPDFETETWNDTFGFNLFFNYSFLTESAKVLPYLGAQFTYDGTFSGTDTYIAGNYSGTFQDIYNSSLGANAGLKYFITDRVNLDGNLSYTAILSTTTETESTTIEGDPEGGLLQFTIGLGIILGKR